MDTQYVLSDPEIMSGTPCFRDTRVTIKTLFDYLEGGSSLDDFLTDFPSVSRDMAVTVLEAEKCRLLADGGSA